MKLENKNIYCIGIKGVGMTAMTQLLYGLGAQISGVDSSDSFFLDEDVKDFFDSNNIVIHNGFDAGHITEDIDIVIASAAYYFNGKAEKENPEVKEVLAKNIPIYTYPEAVGLLSAQKKIIAVAGSHGKSTTTAILGTVLEKTNIDPSVLVGTKVTAWKRNARSGKSDLLVVEGDEYRDAFLKYKSHGAIITNVDYDHPDHYATEEIYVEAFKKFIDTINPDGFLVIAQDGKHMKELAAYAKEKIRTVVTYGSNEATYHIEDKGTEDGLQKGSINEAPFTLRFPGCHNVLNAAAAIIAATLLGVSEEDARNAVADFEGTARRMEIKIKEENYIRIDDYAHHPTEIKATLQGIRALYPKWHIRAVFQPHTFSRTKALLDDFQSAFTDADEVILVPAYASARESVDKAFGSNAIYELLKETQSIQSLTFKETRKALEHHDQKTVDVIMGAGNITKQIFK